MENLFLALTNLPILYPIWRSYQENDLLTFYLLCFLGVASFLSHLVENHKHSMRGIGFSPRFSYFLNRLDVLGSLLLAARLSCLCYLLPNAHWINGPKTNLIIPPMNAWKKAFLQSASAIGKRFNLQPESTIGKYLNLQTTSIIWKKQFVFFSLDNWIYFWPFIFSFISEFDQHNPRYKRVYIITHAIWHISIFITIDHFLRDVIY